MKLLSLCMCICGCMSLNSNAQNYFNYTFDQDEVWQFGLQVRQLTTGEFLLAGDSDDSTSEFGQLLIRINEDGVEQWRKYIHVDGNYFEILGMTDEFTSSGEFYGGGNITNPSTQISDLFLIKYSSIGDTLWTKSIDWDNEGASDVVLMNDSFFSVTGFINTFNVTEPDAFLVRLDSSGSQQWVQFYGGTEDDRAGSIVMDEQGNYFLGGYSNSNFSNGSYDNYLIKTDSSGILVFDSTYGGVNSDGGMSVVTVRNDTLFMFGYMDTIMGNPLPLPKSYVGAMDLIGNFYWRYFFNQSDTEQIIIWNATVDESGSVYLCGEKNEALKGWLGKVDRNGNFLWERTFQTRPNEPLAQHYLTDVQVLANGDIICTGTAESITDTTRFDWDIWVLKVDSNGCLLPGCATGIEPIKKQESNFILYPNPANDFTTIMLERPLKKKTEVRFYNMIGEEIFTETAEQGMIDITIEVSCLPASLYLCTLWQEGVMIGSKKVVVK